MYIFFLYFGKIFLLLFVIYFKIQKNAIYFLYSRIIIWNSNFRKVFLIYLKVWGTRWKASRCKKKLETNSRRLSFASKSFSYYFWLFCYFSSILLKNVLIKISWLLHTKNFPNLQTNPKWLGFCSKNLWNFFFFFFANTWSRKLQVKISLLFQARKQPKLAKLTTKTR